MSATPVAAIGQGAAAQQTGFLEPAPVNAVPPQHRDLVKTAFDKNCRLLNPKVRKSDVELRRELDAYLDNLRSGPSWNRLIVVYFGEKALSALGRAR